jgi:hypothetical protein
VADSTTSGSQAASAGPRQATAARRADPRKTVRRSLGGNERVTGEWEGVKNHETSGCRSGLWDEGRSCSHPPLSAALPEVLEPAAQLAAAQGDDRVGPGDGPMYAGALAPRSGRDSAVGLDDSGRGAQSRRPDCVAHARTRQRNDWPPFPEDRGPVRMASPPAGRRYWPVGGAIGCFWASAATVPGSRSRKRSRSRSPRCRSFRP